MQNASNERRDENLFVRRKRSAPSTHATAKETKKQRQSHWSDIIFKLENNGPKIKWVFSMTTAMAKPKRVAQCYFGKRAFIVDVRVRVVIETMTVQTHTLPYYPSTPVSPPSKIYFGKQLI